MNDGLLALRSLTIVMDTREKDRPRRDARVQSLKAMGATVVQAKLDFGDYSAFYTDPATGEAVDLGTRIVVERKMSIEELVGCLTRDRSRFEAELRRATDAGAHLIIAVESGSLADLFSGRYDTDARASSMEGSYHAILLRYDIEIVWLTPELFARFVYGVYRRMVLDDVVGVPRPAGA